LGFYLGDFHTVPSQGILRTFFLSLRTSLGNKISGVCLFCNLFEVDLY